MASDVPNQSRLARRSCVGQRLQLVGRSLSLVIALAALMFVAPHTVGATITQIIDSTGDGTHGLLNPHSVTVGNGPVYVSGTGSNNVFRILTAQTPTATNTWTPTLKPTSTPTQTPTVTPSFTPNTSPTLTLPRCVETPTPLPDIECDPSMCTFTMCRLYGRDGVCHVFSPNGLPPTCACDTEGPTPTQTETQAPGQNTYTPTKTPTIPPPCEPPPTPTATSTPTNSPTWTPTNTPTDRKSTLLNSSH